MKNLSVENQAANIEFDESIYTTSIGELTFLNFGMKRKKTLVSYLNYVEKNNPYKNSSLILLQLDEEFTDKKVRKLLYELASAIDKNSVSDIKNLKIKYGASKEFATAKSYLNKKCKEVWDIFDTSHKKSFVPRDAMRTLGITNQYSLDFLLSDSLKFYISDNSNVLFKVVDSIVDNINISYNLKDIIDYLLSNQSKYGFNFSKDMQVYFLRKSKFDRCIYKQLNITKEFLFDIFLELSMFEKCQFVYCLLFPNATT